jgi:hypothetical protein
MAAFSFAEAAGGGAIMACNWGLVGVVSVVRGIVLGLWLVTSWVLGKVFGRAILFVRESVTTSAASAPAFFLHHVPHLTKYRTLLHKLVLKPEFVIVHTFVATNT